MGNSVGYRQWAVAVFSHLTEGRTEHQRVDGGHVEIALAPKKDDGELKVVRKGIDVKTAKNWHSNGRVAKPCSIFW